MATAAPQPPIEQLLTRMAPEIASSFTESQLASLRAALKDSTSARRHPVDLRFTLPVWRWRLFVVLLVGHDRRTLTRRQEFVFRLTELGALAGFLLFSTLMGLLVLYLLKSWLGIDIFPNHSFGVWDWFRGRYLS
ncbi:MAG: hypothetical protein ACFCUG_12485 [Thiotrichales bacterium]